MKLNKIVDNNLDTDVVSTTASQAPHLRVVENDGHIQSVKTRKRRNTSNPLRQVRVESGLTLDDLAESSGLSPSYLSRLEGGSRRLNMEILELLCETLSCHQDVLMPMTKLPEKTDYAKKVSAGPIASVASIKKMTCYTLSADGSQGYTINNETSLVKRPVALANSSQGFSLAVNDESLIQAFNVHHQLIYVDPTAHFAIADKVFVQTAQDHCALGMLKDVHMDSNVLQHIVLSLASGNELKIERDQVVSLFKVIIA